MKIGKQCQQQGFSLLEILVAFSILAFALTILLNIFSSGLRRTLISEEYQQAVIIAQSKLATIGVEEELGSGNPGGDMLEKYFWSVNMEPLHLDSLDLEGLGVIPYQVTVIVEWLAGKNNRRLELTTIKLAKE